MQTEWCVKFGIVLAHVAVTLVGNAEGLNYLACFKENSPNDRLLKGARKEFRRSLTPEICLSYCKTKGMRYFGLQYSYECFCSVDRPPFKSVTNEDECDMKCEGNPRETCGGGLRLSVYDSEVDLSTAKYVGCFRERSVTARLMSGASQEFRGALTNSKCIEFCRGKGFAYAGTQYSFECFCSNERPHFKSFADESDCNAKCDGDENDSCGGGFRLSVYDLYDKRTDHVFSNFLGCYEVTPYQNDLLPSHREYFEKKLTPEFCVGYCYRRGYRYAGMKSGSSCYCGNSVDANSKVNDAQCNTPCSGDNKLKCGGTERMSIYHTEISDQSEEGRLLGCYEDNGSRRILSGHMSDFKETLTPKLCLNVCLQLGFKYSGVEAGYECHCGNRPPSSELERPENECLMYCPGDRLKLCGGGWRLLVFSTGSGTSSSKPIPARLPARPTMAMTTTRRPLTQETKPDTVRPESSSKPLTVRPISSSKPQIVKPGSSRPVTASASSKPMKPTQKPITSPAKPHKPVQSNNKPAQSSTKPAQTSQPSYSTKPNQIKPQPPSTTKKPQIQPGTTRKPTTMKPTPTQQQTFWTNQPSRETNVWPNQQPQTTWVTNAQQQSTWGTKPPQQTTLGTNSQQPTFGLNPQQQTTYGSNPQQQTTFGTNPQQQTTFGSNPQQQSTFGLNPQQQTTFESNPEQQTTFGANPSPQRPQSTWTTNTAQPTSWGNNKPFQQEGSNSVIGPSKPAQNNQVYTIAGTTLSNEPVTGRPNCIRSVTEVKGENACRGEVLFVDDFSEGKRINNFKWTHEVIMPWTPDYEFVVYRKTQQNSFLRNRKLFIKPTLFDDDFVKRGLLELESCTGLLHSEECRRQGASYNIIPPVESARLTTKENFSFKYGKIEIRAKLPLGDWIVPEIWLEPKRKHYGTGAYTSGRVRIAMARGNANLDFDGRDIGNKQLEVGILMGVGTAENIRARTIIRDKTDGWYRSFHNFTLIWSPDNLKFLVDGQHEESLMAGGQPLYQLAGFDEELGETWKHGSVIAPFDKEFYITLGVSVGGMRDFPDECRSSGREKPWRNMAVKAMASFWEDRRYWQNTWDDDNSALQVEHVIVTAL